MNSHIAKVGIVTCSNGQKKEYEEQIKALEMNLLAMDLQPIFGDYIYEKESVFSGTAQERADALMRMYENEEITEIFDISGGDIANGILPYLDYDRISRCDKRFWGYSDLTTVVNAIYAKTGKSSVLYQLKNLVWDESGKQMADFKNTMLDNKKELFDFSYRFLQQEKMQGIVVGGNIRCFLKLAGTEYMPNLTGKILLLESLGGTVAQMETYLCQLQQLGAFEKVAGILLGTFTEMESNQCQPTIEMLVKRIAGNQLPIAKTKEIGHGTDSKAIVIGQTVTLE